jgi:hypothetical protein
MALPGFAETLRRQGKADIDAIAKELYPSEIPNEPELDVSELEKEAAIRAICDRLAKSIDEGNLGQVLSGWGTYPKLFRALGQKTGQVWNITGTLGRLESDLKADRKRVTAELTPPSFQPGQHPFMEDLKRFGPAELAQYCTSLGIDPQRLTRFKQREAIVARLQQYGRTAENDRRAVLDYLLNPHRVTRGRFDTICRLFKIQDPGPNQSSRKMAARQIVDRLATEFGTKPKLGAVKSGPPLGLNDHITEEQESTDSSLASPASRAQATPPLTGPKEDETDEDDMDEDEGGLVFVDNLPDGDDEKSEGT